MQRGATALIPHLESEMRRAVEELPKRLASGDVDLARQELKGLTLA
jgi:hypothetical protein